MIWRLVLENAIQEVNDSMIRFIFIPLPRNEVPSPSPYSRRNLESLVGELEKTVASLRKQVKHSVFVFCGIWSRI